MKNTFAALALAAGNAYAGSDPAHGDGCNFQLIASGGVSGIVGQLGDGQNRIAQTGGLAIDAATYSLTNGGLIDQSGRGCILTPPTTQFQCDVGATRESACLQSISSTDQRPQLLLALPTHANSA